MLQRADTDLYNPSVPKAQSNVSKYNISFTNKANKNQLMLIGGFLFFAPSRLGTNAFSLIQI